MHIKKLNDKGHKFYYIQSYRANGGYQAFAFAFLFRFNFASFLPIVCLYLRIARWFIHGRYWPSLLRLVLML